MILAYCWLLLGHLYGLARLQEIRIFIEHDLQTWLCTFSSVQSFSHVQLFATSWIAARQASLSITNSQSSLKLMSIELVMPSSHLILCCPLLLLPPVPPSIRVFSNESTPQQTKIKPHSAYSPVFPNSDWVSTYSLIHCNSYIHSTNSHLSQLVFWEPGTLPVFMEFKSNSPL